MTTEPRRTMDGTMEPPANTSMDAASRLSTAVSDIRAHYIADTKDLVTGKQKRRQRHNTKTLGVVALEGQFADALRSVVTGRGHEYKLKASAGQPDRSFLLVPYVMLLRMDVTTTPRRGTYVALLFEQDLKALWITLNQGLQQYEERFGLPRSQQYAGRAAKVIAASVSIPRGFTRGPVQLGATTLYGKAYEQGAIFGRRYPLDSFDEGGAKAFLLDLQRLVDFYDALPRYGFTDPSIAIASQSSGDDETAYQEMANTAVSKTLAPVDDRPKAPSTQSKRKTGEAVSVRDVQVARDALLRAEYSCEARCSNPSFRAAVANHPYVEAHHLIPIARQKEFTWSLDVPANVVCLCPSCHAKVHRGHDSVRTQLILQLYLGRIDRLKASGLEVSKHDLLSMY